MLYRHTLFAGLLSALAGPVLANVQAPLTANPLSQEEPSWAAEQVWRLDWSSLGRDAQLEILDAVELLELDVWRSSRNNIDIRLHPTSLLSLRRFIPSDIPFSPFITDLQALISSQRPAPTPSNGTWDLGSIDSTFHNEYHSLEDIYAFGDALVEEFDGVNGLHVRSFLVGKTFEGREIRGFKAWADSEEQDATEREFVVQSGSHAREWIGPAAALYWLHDVILSASEAGAESDATKLFQSFTFSVIPTINPDGYEYSLNGHRLWRKNRQDVGSPICLGLDLNSNWGYKWRPAKASQCSDAYAGKAAFEAYETRAAADYLKQDRSEDGQRERQVWAFVDLHSYGQLFMYPFAHSCDDFPPDAETLMEAGLGVAKAMRSDHGEDYQAGQACDLTYRAPGDSIDYVYSDIDTRWTYSAELRDTGTYGFLLPPSLIRPSAQEAAAGLWYLAKFIYNLELAP